MKNQQISVPDLLQKNYNIPLGKAKDFTTSNFWHYTKMGAANSIASSLEFHCGAMSNCNDKIESRRHESEKDFLHVISFCHSDSEQIPMWYLYSGIDGKGAAIKITPATMIEFINSIATVKTSDGKTLYKDTDFELLYGWVYYVRHHMLHNEEEIVDSDRPDAGVIYRGVWYDINDWKSFIDGNYFVKDYPWHYEKEFRIVIKNKTQTKCDKLIVQLPITKSGIDVKCAPSVPTCDKQTIKIGEIEKPLLQSDLDIHWILE